MASGPRVLLVTPQGLAARALLRTDVLPTLLAAGSQVTVLAPDDPALARELGERGVRLEPLGDVDRLLTRSTVRRAFVALRYFTLGDGQRAATLGVKARTAMGELAVHRPWAARALRLGVRPLWRSARLRRLVLRVEVALDRSHLHAGALDRVRPDVVVTTTPGLFYADALVLREARRRGLRTAAVILGWDNPTAKGYRGADVDLAIAWSERMAAQLVRHHDFPAARVAVAGVPHFDRYLRPDRRRARDEALAALGLDPDRRTVIFTSPSPDLWASNADVAETLAAAVEEERLGAPAQLVIRPHPNFSLPRVRESAAPLAAAAARFRHVHLFTPELTAGALAVATSAADVDRLAGLLTHADVLVNVFSTTTLEAFLVDTPVVALSESVGWRDNASRPGGPRTWDDFAHLEAVRRAGAARVARTLDDLVTEVALYLADPARDRAARARVAREECGPLDGASGERVGRLLLAIARET